MKKLLSALVLLGLSPILHGCSNSSEPSSNNSDLEIVYTRFDYSNSDAGANAIIADSTGKTIRDLGQGIIRTFGSKKLLVMMGDTVTETARLFVSDRRGNSLKAISQPQEVYAGLYFLGSSNGETIAYGTEDSLDRRTIVITNAEGSHRTTFTNWAHETVFALSPDGKEIAFMRESGGAYELCLANIDGSALEILETLTTRTASDGYSGVYWGGNALVYTDNNMVKHIDLATKKVTEIGVGILPRIGPDGHTIVYTGVPGSTDLVITHDLGITSENLTNTTDRAEAYAEFSPDGNKLLFIHWQGDYDHVPGTMGMIDLSTKEITDLATPVIYGYWVK